MKTDKMLITLAIVICFLFAWIGTVAGSLMVKHEQITDHTSYSRQLADEAIESANEFILICEEYEAN